MLDSFTVQGFRGFSKKTEIRFDKPRHYDFNEELIKDGRVNHALLYGPNGCGKSSLTEAIMDIQINRSLVRGQGVSLMGNPKSFLNGDSEKEATFRYEFSFGDSGTLLYEYGKPSFFEVNWERIFVEGKVVLDRKGPIIKCHIPGTENVNFRSMAPNVSAFFYLANFLSFPEDSIYGQLVDFVDRMLWFRSLLQGNESQSGAIVPGPEFITDVIARDGRIKELEDFLREKTGVNLSLEAGPTRNIGGAIARTIVAKFKNRSFDIGWLSSSGTQALLVFFYWKKHFPKLSFLCIDEFDAYYHYTLARDVVEIINSFQGFQSLLTTHNTDLMSNLLSRPDCIFLMGEGKVAPLSDLTEKELREVHNLAKIYKGGGFQIDHGE